MGAKKKHQNGDAKNTAQITSTAMDGNSSNAAGSSAYAQLSFNDVLEDLSSRFIVNLPAEEQKSIERICFQVEQAHWFYEDFLRPLNPSLPSLALRRFSSFLLHAAALTVPLIQKYIATSSSNQQGLDVAFDEFLSYKTRVPVCGAVMLNYRLNKCVLVKGWKASAAWGFPKGKINQQESERGCAVREVYEETGYDCGPLVPAASTDFIECTMRNQRIRLYIVPGVDEDTQFETQTRKEISKIAWFSLSDLPTWKENKAPPQGMGGKFYLISPFVGMLKKWIQQNRTKHKASGGSKDRGAAGLDEGDEVYTGDEEDVHLTTDRTNDLKALLGVGATPVGSNYAEALQGKGPQMIEEQGDARGRQLLELLRGAPTSNELRPGTPQQHFGSENEARKSLDERERGTASLLAALNAGSGRPRAGDTLNGDGASLLTLLNGTSPSVPAVNSDSPLPAPRAQRTVQTQSLLNLIGPSASTALSEAKSNGTVAYPAQAPNLVIANNLNDPERDRAMKRDALLSNLLSSSLNINTAQQDQMSSNVTSAAAYAYPPPPPQVTQQYQSTTQTLLHNGMLPSYAYPPSLQYAAPVPPTSVPTRQQSGPVAPAAHQAQLPSQSGSNALLSLLNAGPPTSAAPSSMAPPQQPQYSSFPTSYGPSFQYPPGPPPPPPPSHHSYPHQYGYPQHYPTSPYPPQPPTHIAASPNAYHGSTPGPPAAYHGHVSAR
jgi:mRNA-decapping enzyme subunit 2